MEKIMTPAIEELEAALDWNRNEISDIEFALRDGPDDGWQKNLSVCETIRDTLTQAIAIAEGDMVVVPREPTREMTMAGCDMLPSTEGIFGQAGAVSARVYKAMIAAAQGGGGGK